MEPTCRSGQIKWVNRLAYRWSAPKRGDVVAIQGNDLRFLYLKRVIGLAGEMIAITNGTVVINGVPLAEPYVNEQEEWDVPPIRLRENQYLVIGDNRVMHQALHLFGTVDRSRIVGHVLGGR
jgi:signal peptidase I